ncbi:outer dense fiber protein 2-like [Nerophis ophidion]|uniref:outer dense fiber protein 2-like n=1 Tax=Nerophis ophidion TaxID=159077 RepID=UPI002ADF58F3|nr:outer dense fiber protein 2-like [Nerophis ophidion]
MITRHSPPPVHVHVPETSPVHVHVRRSPSRTPQDRTRDPQVKGERGRSRGRAPWIPPGISSWRPDQRSSRGTSDGVRHGGEHQEERTDAVNLSDLLKEQEGQRFARGDTAGHSTDVLLRALVEAEVDGVAVANQLRALQETLERLGQDKRPSRLQTTSLGRQRRLLLEKMEIFDNTNHSLRELIRDWTETEQRESTRLFEENRALKTRLADCEADNMRLVSKMAGRDQEASQLADSLAFEKEHARTSEELARILGSTRDHLESQLSRCEADKAHLAAQLQRMQHNFQQLRGNEEQAALTLLTQRAERAEDASRQLSDRLQDKESQLAQALSTCSELRLRNAKEASARSQLDDEVAGLKTQVNECRSQLHVADQRSRAEREELRDQLHALSAEKTSILLDKQTLQAEIISCEEKVKKFQDENFQVKTLLRKQESMLDKYKKKAQHAEREREEMCVKVHEVQQEVCENIKCHEEDKQQMMLRLRELEKFPERLKRSEQLLREAREEADAHQRRSQEHNSALAEVRSKVEHQGCQLENFQRRNLLLQQDNNLLNNKIHTLDRKLEEVQQESQQVRQALSLKEASLLGVEQQLEVKVRECGVLSRQLQQALDDARQQVDDSVHRVLVKERLSQSKALDLQGQLGRAEAELSQLHRSKEEMERRFQNQLKNLKERLEQSDSTNRSLQNYVQFLKTSYGNVFGESLLSSS